MSYSPQSTVDLSTITDPESRRALGAIQQEYLNALHQQRAELDAILEVLIEKHLTSVGELRRHIAKHQQAATANRATRLHDQLWSTTTAPTTPAPPQPAAK